jgi:hypothetical protein
MGTEPTVGLSYCHHFAWVSDGTHKEKARLAQDCYFRWLQGLPFTAALANDNATRPVGPFS